MEFTRQVIQTNPNPTYVKNESGSIIIANDAFAALHGLKVDELLAKGTGTFDYSYDRDLELLETWDELSFEEFYKLHNGEKVWFKTTKKPFMHSDGTRYLLSVSSDITALKNAMQAAEDAAKAQENFLASISNEIRTPINAIIGIAKLLKKSHLNKDQEGYLDTIVSIADNLLIIPNDVLDISKLESGEVKLVKVPFDIISVISDTVRAIAFKTQEQAISVRFTEPAEKIPVVEGDPFRLSQVLVNLMSNAIKYTHQGEIVISVEHLDKSENIISIEFCVQDTGAGFSADKFEKYYEALSKEKSSITRLYGGSGLGLTLSQKLVELQGGKIWLENRPNQGSCFYFTIPYTISDKATPVKREKPAIKPELLKGLRILIAEDNQLNELLLTSQLQSWGISYEVTYDGEQALAKANEQEYDLILMDIQMPKLDGIEATYRIRNKQNPNRNTPIIAFTANFQDIDVERYKYYGFTDCLLKPYRESRLLRLISRYTGRSMETHETEPQVETPKEELVLYDFSGLGNLKDDAVFIRKMQQMFIDTVPKQLDELTEAFGKKDLDTTAHIAHKLKSTYGNIRIRQAAEAMKKVEEYTKGKLGADEVEGLLQAAREVTEKVVRIFTNQLHSNI